MLHMLPSSLRQLVSARKLVRLLLSRVAPFALVCFLSWLRYRTWQSKLEEDASHDYGTSRVEADESVGVQNTPVDSQEDAKTKKALKEKDWRRRRQLEAQKTDEEKAIEKAQKQLEAARKFARACEKAVELRATIRDRLAAACHDLPIVFTSVDVEAWEQDGDKVTEIGIATASISHFDAAEVEAQASAIVFRHRHLLVRENLELRNGTHVEDNKDGFLFGDSEVLPLADAATELATEINVATFVVGHALQGDLAWLRKIGVTGLDSSSMLERRFVDTQTLAFAAAGLSPSDPPKLGLRPMAEAYGLIPRCMHNGGNDAAFTLQIMLSQCGVGFPPPVRTISNHRLSPEFQRAMDEALERLSESDRLWSTRQHELRTTVDMFSRNTLDTITGRCGVAISNEGGREVLRFPALLLPRERRVVHKAAEDLGLQSRSTEDSTTKERYVAVFRGSADGMATTKVVATAVGTTGKRKKHTKHCKWCALGECWSHGQVSRPVDS